MLFSDRHLANRITENGEKRECYSLILSRMGENGMFYDENKYGLLFAILLFRWCIHDTIAHIELYQSLAEE